ncbi:cardiolipin synthase [Paenirhodobacter populi]|uniref:cardiolipin synthase n=1 Tax=Paenirhodobacter populi TaxID=2306993 RepID=UPI001F4EC38D|nr:cardiolipin synthase [Sinirhodobacter populi]
MTGLAEALSSHFTLLAVPVGLLLLHGTAVILAFRAIRTARTPQGAVGWTVFLIALPYVGVPAYFIFGDIRYPAMIRDRKLSEAAARLRNAPEADVGAPPLSLHASHLMAGFEAIAARPAVGGNAVELLIESRVVFETLFASIREAEHYVLIETYILRDDGLGRALQDLLLEKRAQGVRVCVLYDPVGSYGLHRSYLDRMREGGIEINNFHARHPQRRLSLTRVNFRNHRKIAVVDGNVAFTGGYNIGDEYIGRDPRLGPWRDTMIRLEGPVVDQLQLHFAEDWHWATGEVLDLEWRPDVSGLVPALALASGPSDAQETGALFFTHAITAARQRLWIASPYFTPDTGLMQALRLAALRGVDVRILIAGERDHWLVWLAGFAFIEAMRGSGVKIYRYSAGFMHQKVVLVDDDIAAVGSHNLDSRSCRLNFEASVVLADPAFAAEVAAMLEEDFSRARLYSRPLADASWPLRIAAPVARLFAPVL